jgi:hypothetical protein
LIEAQQNTSQILDAERTASTVNYVSPAAFANQLAMAASALGQRGWHPRPVSENPGYYYLQSRNYELLKSFFEEITPSERPLFLRRFASAYLIRIHSRLWATMFLALGRPTGPIPSCP